MLVADHVCFCKHQDSKMVEIKGAYKHDMYEKLVEKFHGM